MVETNLLLRENIIFYDNDTRSNVLNQIFIQKMYVSGLFGVYFIFTSFVERYFMQRSESSNIPSCTFKVSTFLTDNSVKIFSISFGHLLSKGTATSC